MNHLLAAKQAGIFSNLGCRTLTSQTWFKWNVTHVIMLSRQCLARNILGGNISFYVIIVLLGFSGGSVVKNPPANANDSGSTPG